jgi:hypothetical protein
VAAAFYQIESWQKELVEHKAENHGNAFQIPKLPFLENALEPPTHLLAP